MMLGIHARLLETRVRHQFEQNRTKLAESGLAWPRSEIRSLKSSTSIYEKWQTTSERKVERPVRMLQNEVHQKGLKTRESESLITGAL